MNAIGNLTGEVATKPMSFLATLPESKAGEVQPLIGPIEEYPTTAISLR